LSLLKAQDAALQQGNCRTTWRQLFSFAAAIPPGMSGGPIFDRERVYVYGQYID
jgi:hypothetical protein